MQTVREQLVTALGELVEEAESAGVAAGDNGAIEQLLSRLPAGRLALDRARAEPEGRLYPEQAVAPLRMALTNLVGFCKAAQLQARDIDAADIALHDHYALGFTPAEPVADLEPCNCDGPDCPGYQEGLEAQREPAGRGTP